MSLLGIESRFEDEHETQSAGNGTVGVVRMDAINDTDGRRCGRTSLDGQSYNVQAEIA